MLTDRADEKCMQYFSQESRREERDHLGYRG